MSILQMSISAGLLVIAVIIIRAFFKYRLPKTMFLILWGVVLLRLLVPISIPSRFSIYTVADRFINQTIPGNVAPMIRDILPLARPVIDETDSATGIDIVEAGKAEDAGHIVPLMQEDIPDISPLTIIWLIGMFAMSIFFTVVYSNNRRELRFALPLRNHKFLNEWLSEHKTLRPIHILQSDRITTPVAVGIRKPRIILPRSMNMDDEQLLEHVLMHEYYHIRRFDALWKLLLMFALCIHWFNPFVWIMFWLAIKDLELTCDEMVVRNLGFDTKAAYAYSIIGMAEQQSKFTPLYNGFSKNAAEERIVSIMKYKKPSIIRIVLAVFLVAVPTTAFALSAYASEEIKENVPDTQIVDIVYAKEEVKKDVKVKVKIAPLHIDSSGVVYDEGIYRWPYNAIRVTNTGYKKIMGYEITSLAYDKDGNPLKLYWDARNMTENGEIGSVGFSDGVDYDIVTGILPRSPKSYHHTYVSESPDDIEAGGLSSGEDEVLSYSLLDGWNQSTGKHSAAYIISSVKQVTFEDNSVWENPEYENWLTEYEGKSMDAIVLEDYNIE